METFYKENSDVQEWVDILIEKLFTVSLLSGPEADSEFYRGRQAAGKISSILQSITNLPEDILKDGIRQLIEQRLPDTRVIENFPQFYSLMEEMINTKPLITEEERNEDVAVKVFGIINPSVHQLPSTLFNDSSISPVHGLEQDRKPEQEIEEDIELIEPIEQNTGDIEPILGEDLEQVVREDLEPGSAQEKEQILPILNEEIPTQNKREPLNPIPSGAEQLVKVLKQFFPDDQLLWNKKIDDYLIFAQIKNLAVLIPNNSSESEKMKKRLEKQGLNVLICHEDDLAYPRRLERFVRQTLRHTLSSNTSSSFLS
ncbi:hypothetical protein [Desulfitobacterium sp.]|uniref:hypothetical protein n=1 Tax=Desulfitobacterium sp. TaxID=49981 RepID=UPI002B1EE7B5|nr:hypothetical protein [Desulfitobacterium sp.]MEA4900507.1 hypothetical protein [Desulfitobacterium sp.]